MIILFVLLILLIPILMWDLIGMSVVGFPKSDEEILKVLETLKNNEPEGYDDGFRATIAHMYKSKILDETMIYTFGKPYISKAIKGFSFGWYVDGYGAVPRWYKSHSEITKLYNELKSK